MMSFYLFGGPRACRDQVPVHLGNKQQQLLTALMLFANRPVTSDILVDHLWSGDLPANPLNSLQDLVKRLRYALGDYDRTVIVTRDRSYSLAVKPDQLDLSIFDRLANAGLALELAEPSSSNLLLAKALEISKGDLPDGVPGSRAGDAIDDICSLRQMTVSASRSAYVRPPVELASALAIEGPATGLAVRLADLEDLMLADVVGEIVRFHGRVCRLTDGLLISTFAGAAAALRCGSAVSALLAPANGLLGGAVCRLRSGASARCVNRLLQLVGSARPNQVLVTSSIKDAAATSGVAALLRPFHDDVWQISIGPVFESFGRRAAAEVPMVGRDEVISEIGDLLVRSSLITLRGPGGIGKTRIARELAHRLAQRFRDGVYFVDLAEADHHGGPLSLVVRSLGFVPEPYRHPENTLVDLLGRSESLLVLDNCERFTEEMRSLCEALGDSCASLTILTTSRSALGASRELIRDIGELDLVDAAQLLVALAFSEESGASPDALDPMIVRLCAQLDSVPLAIECAASMVRAMGLEGAAAALSSLPDGAILPLLDAAHGGRGRHRSIELALSASYRALREEDAILHERISSLRGGFLTEDAAGVVVEARPEAVAAGLGRLCEASLVKQTGDRRWRVLEPVRQFGATRLLRRGEQALQAARHARHFIGLATEAEEGLRGPDEKSWFLRLSEAYANLDKALSWAVQSGDAVGAVQLTSSLWWYWAAQGMFVEGLGAMERSLALEGSVPPGLRAKTLVAASHLAWWAGNPQRTESSCIEAMELISDIGPSDPGIICLDAWTHTGLAAARFWGGGHYEVLERHLEKGKC